MVDLFIDSPNKTNMIRTKLRPNETHYLRLVLHGYKANDIRHFIDVREKVLSLYKKRIAEKLNCKTFGDAIIEAFKINILDKYDYVNSIVKDQALIYAEIVCNRINGLGENMNTSINALAIVILEFYNTCEVQLSIKNGKMFSSVEKKYLELCFNGYERNSIINILKLSPQNLTRLEKAIFKKLDTSEWFNCYKKVFELTILNRKDYITIDPYKEAIESASKMITMHSFSSLSDGEKQLAIYHQLIIYYNLLEYDCLLKMKIS